MTPKPDKELSPEASSPVNEQLVEAVARAIDHAWGTDLGAHKPMAVKCAKAALRAALPLLEEEIREQILRAIIEDFDGWLNTAKTVGSQKTEIHAYKLAKAMAENFARERDFEFKSEQEIRRDEREKVFKYLHAEAERPTYERFRREIDRCIDNAERSLTQPEDGEK